MGCEFIAYEKIPECSCSMGYSEYNRLRMEFMHILGAPEEFCDTSDYAKAYNYLMDNCGDVMTDGARLLLDSSDCDAHWSGCECVEVLEFLRSIEPKVKDESSRLNTERLISVFESAGHDVVEIW